MLKKIVFLIPVTTCMPPIASKRIVEIPPFSNPQFSRGNTGKLRVIFLHTNAAFDVQNRVQFAWAKTQWVHNFAHNFMLKFCSFQISSDGGQRGRTKVHTGRDAGSVFVWHFQKFTAF